MRSGNPALKDDTFLDLGSGRLVQGDAGAMTLNGAVNKTAILLVLSLAGAMFTWAQFSAAMAAGNPGAVMPYVWGGTGMLPSNLKAADRNDLNWLGSFAGAMSQSPADSSPDEGPLPGDLETARLFGIRIAEQAIRLG